MIWITWLTSADSSSKETSIVFDLPGIATASPLLFPSRFAPNSSELTIHVPQGLHERIDFLCLYLRMRVVAETGDDSTMSTELSAVMQCPEMLSVQRQDDAVFGYGDFENLFVRFA